MKNSGKSKVDTVFVLIIFSVFALSVLLVLMLGARVYKNMTDITSENQEERTFISYVWTKVKNGDKNGSARAGEFGGLSALCFDEVIGGDSYQTVIYHLKACWVYGDDWDNRVMDYNWEDFVAKKGWVSEEDWEGWLSYETGVYELFYEEGLDMKPTDGTKVIAIGNAVFDSVDNGMIRVSTDHLSLLLSPRSDSSGVAPAADFDEGVIID